MVLLPSADSAPRVETSVANGSAHIVVRKAGCMNPHVGLADGDGVVGSEVVGSEVGSEVGAGVGAGVGASVDVAEIVVAMDTGTLVGNEIVGISNGDGVRSGWAPFWSAPGLSARRWSALGSSGLGSGSGVGIGVHSGAASARSWPEN